MNDDHAENADVLTRDVGVPKLPALLSLEKFLSKRRFRIALDAGTIGFFLFLIVGPILAIVLSISVNWATVRVAVFDDPITGDIQWQIMLTALARSFQIAAIATVLDLIIGLPMAFILTRYEFKGKHLLDTLVDLPMAVPTSALGFSLYLFFGTNFGISGLMGLEQGLVAPGPVLIILTHVVFTYPFIVRNLKVIFQETSKSYEDAAKTLGASGFTVFRTVTMPLAKEGILAGTVIAFTRSLGETGATIIVAGVFETAPLVVVALRQSMQFPTAAFLSAILIVISLAILVLLRVLSRKIGFPVARVWPKLELRLSSKTAKLARNITGLVLFLVLVLVPALYTIPFVLAWFSTNPYTLDTSGTVLAGLLSSDNKWAWLWVSTMNSITIATVSTGACLLFGLPMAMILVKRKWGKIKGVIDAMVDIPLIVPTAALGFAMYLFWGSGGLGLFQPGFWLVTLVHMAMCFPYIVRPIIAVLEKTDPLLEEAARTLGAPALTTFRTITLPKMKPGIIAGMIMSFTRSMGETGATLVTAGLVRTVPIIIVDWFETGELAVAGFASVVLIGFSFVMLLLLRRSMEKR